MSQYDTKMVSLEQAKYLQAQGLLQELLSNPKSVQPADLVIEVVKAMKLLGMTDKP